MVAIDEILKRDFADMLDQEVKLMLQKARANVKSGAYAEALNSYSWVYENGMVYDPMWIGPRNSFVVMEWAELGQVYPPARTDLESVLKAKTARLREGALDHVLFHDVMAINRALGQLALTSALFAEIAERNPEFAQKCFPFALPALIETLDISLARRFIRSPEEFLAVWIKMIQSSIKNDDGATDDKSNLKRWGSKKIYLDHVHQLLDVLVGVGEIDEAARAAAFAIGSVPPSQCRDEIRNELSSYLQADNRQETPQSYTGDSRRFSTKQGMEGSKP
jgi:hypothetical protein